MQKVTFRFRCVPLNRELTQQERDHSLLTGLKREEHGKPCVTSVTIILFEITFRQTSLSFKQIFLVKDRKTLMLSMVLFCNLVQHQ